MSRCIADLRNSNVFSNSFALQCAGLKVELTMMVPMCESLFVNLLLADLDFGACSMSDAIDCVSLLIGIHTGDVVDSERENWRGTVWWRCGARRLMRWLSKMITQGKAPSPLLPSNVPRLPIGLLLRVQPNIPFDLSRCRILKRSSDRLVVSSFNYVGVIFKVIDVSTDLRRVIAMSEVRVHEMLTRLAPQFVIHLLKHFEAEVVLPTYVEPKIVKSVVLVMEEARGEFWPMNPDHDLKLGSALLGAVAALHDLGVAHNDVKWDNVLLDSTWRWVLCDFGLGADARR
jgi:hypothetical protein